MKPRKFSRAAGFLLGLVVLAQLASGAVIGTLTLTSEPGDVNVTLTSIDWTPPVGPGTGRFTVGSGTDLTYNDGTPLTVGTLGTILDLTAGMPFPIIGFMMFDDASDLVFDLTALGPGPSNTVCTDAFDVNAPACSVGPGSPFILQATSTGTAVTLAARGIARDASAVQSEFIGAFTTQIAGRTPSDIQENILGGGVENSTYSAEFTATFIPEPGTVSLLVVGGGLIALAWRRRVTR
jgi:hypothetical protein